MFWRGLVLPSSAVGLAVLLLTPLPARAQAPPATPDQYEVLARGPVHEAFAQPIDYRPEPGPVADKAPPDPVDELPPDQRPDGDDVEWISGYWAWEETEKEYLWISGFWRSMPPDRRWVPGTWQEGEDGWHWTAGFWAPEEAESVEYSPPPPRNLDAGPSTPAVRETDSYVPGCWVWREARFYWRPGFWVEYRPDWVWVPAHYSWAPGGCVFVDGYWDRPLHLRGMLFAPIRVAPAVRAFVYRPTYVVQTDFLLTAMFVGPARRHYHFGDYFEARYERSGYVAWMNYQPSRRAPDPVFGYYQAAYRSQPQWGESLTALYAARRAGTVARPPRTLVQQTTVVNNITKNNTTNVNVVKNVNVTNVQNVTVIRPITQVNNTQVTALAALTPAGEKATDKSAPKQVIKLSQVNQTEINQQKERITQTRDISKQRQQTEAKLIAEPPAKGTSERPRSAPKLELPKRPAAGTVKKADPGEPAAPPRARTKAPAAPGVPKVTEREVPGEDKDPPRTVRPPARKKEGAVSPPKKDKVDPPAKKSPPPKKDKDDDLPPKKSPPPKKEKDDEPPPAKKAPAPKKDKDDDPPAKKSPPPKKDKEEDPPAKKAPGEKKDKDDDLPPKKSPPKKDKD